MKIGVETTHGRVEGVQADRHQVFRGIPYALPPIGNRRFQPPSPAEPWSGALPCAEFGASAPQPPSILPGMASGPTNEDCLYLNVYTPAADGGRRPVMVWIHGGGFTTGSGAQDLYDAGRLCARGDVVVVTINYRLGALGYLHLPEIADSYPNAGQLDQISALEWVQDNAAAFGGDASNVTIFGESAGGVAVSTLLAMPAARGLFHRAIAQSGAASFVIPSQAAGAIAEKLLRQLGIEKGDAGRLRDIPTEKLIEAQTAVLAETRGPGGGLGFAPTLDEATLPEHPLEAVRGGAARDIPLLIGSNLDETKLFTARLARANPVGEAELPDRVRALLPRVSRGNAERIIETYRRARQGSASTEPLDLLDAISSDRSFRIPSIRLAEAQRLHQPRTYAYLFRWQSPAMGGALGACHALELPFVFGTLDAPTMDRFAGSGPDVEALSQRMMDAWLAFARTGEPGHPNLPAWPDYDPERRATMTFDRVCEVVDAPLEDEHRAWEGIL